MRPIRPLLALALLLAAASPSAAVAATDPILEWNGRAGDLLTQAGLGPPPACRVLAIVHTAAYEAVNAITRRYPAGALQLAAAPGASIDAAVAAACRDTLASLVPSQQAAVEALYREALARIPDGAPKSEGLAVGRRAASAVLAARADDGAAAPDAYRPRTTPGIYVPTVLPAVPQWGGRKPWLMSDPAQFRPGPPPALTSETWTRDFTEIKALGGKASAQRTAEQTAIARFWEATNPSIYQGLVRSLASRPGRDVTANARLFAAVAQAMDDALIAVFEAKYHYGFWRPITAIRNGDLDGNDATERDPSWTPFIDTPLHPEYPCAHCIVSGAVGTVLQAEIGSDPVPTLATASPTAGGAVRSWTSLLDFEREVASARIWDGVHYRNSTEVGTAMGRKIGELAARTLLAPARPTAASADGTARPAPPAPAAAPGARSADRPPR